MKTKNNIKPSNINTKPKEDKKDVIDLSQVKLLLKNGIITQKQHDAQIKAIQDCEDVRVKGTRKKDYNETMNMFVEHLSKACLSFAKEHATTKKDGSCARIIKRSNGTFRLAFGIDTEGCRREWDGYVFKNLDNKSKRA